MVAAITRPDQNNSLGTPARSGSGSAFPTGRRSTGLDRVDPLGDAVTMIENVTPLQVLASLTLVALALVLGLVLDLGVTKRLVVAVARAAVQLVAVGLLFGFIAEAGRAMMLAWLWVAAMVAITAVVARRASAPELPGGGPVAGAAVAATVGICLAVIFGLAVLDYTPVNVIVIAGITMQRHAVAGVGGQPGDGRAGGASGPAGGDAVARTVEGPDHPSQRRPDRANRAHPQIERTNVVGLIALPGAMTGLLLAGADPIDAVLVQLIVMYLVLGAVATSVIITVVSGMRGLLPPETSA